MIIEFTPHVYEMLSKNRIYLTPTGEQRLPFGQGIGASDQSVAEPYSGILAGGSIPTIGSFSFTSSGVFPNQIIGRYCSISWGMRVMGSAHPTGFLSTSQFSYDQISRFYRQCIEDDGVDIFRYSYFEPDKTLPVIEHDVWIGQDVLLAQGITLGTGCVIAAGSVVTKSVPPYAIVGGAPAKLIRMRFAPELIERLLASRWWQYKFTDFHDLKHEEPEKFLDHLLARVEAGTIKPFTPATRPVAELLADL